MKVKVPSSIFLILVLCAGLLHAQSGRTEVVNEGKKNQRKLETPSPTPTPEVATAQTQNDGTVAPDDGEVIKVNTQLVSVPVRVMDKKGRFVAGLAKEKFKVFEDGVEQDLELFSNEREPFTVALVLDMSYSTTFKIAEIQNAAIEFINQLRPQDKIMVVSFSEEVIVQCEPTSDRDAISRAIKSTKISTGTSLYEAMDLVMNDRLQKITGRKAVILFTDGVDTTSKKVGSFKNISDAMELDSLIYTIRYDTFADVQNMKNGTGIPKPPPVTVPTSEQTGVLGTILSTMGSSGGGIAGSRGTTEEEYQRAAEYLNDLANRTGGREYEASSLVNLAEAYKKIASELREFYSIGYYPKEDRVAGKKTNVKVKVDEPGVVVRSREGYIRRKSK